MNAGDLAKMRNRLNDFKELKDGWTPEGGLAPDHDGLDWLAGALEDHYPDDITAPHAFPTPDGGVALEWWSVGSKKCDAELEVDLKSRAGEWYVWAECKILDETDVDLDGPDGWSRVAEKIRTLYGR